jgi:hydroxyethylthiazole kinase
VFVRANRAEIDALEAKAAPALAGVAARVVTGAVDEITDRTGRRIAIANGHLDMTRVTGIGCAAGALVAACAAVEPDPAVAATAALLAITIAGELAGARTAGPGTFAASLIDALAGLDAATLLKHARISIDFPS